MEFSGSIVMTLIFVSLLFAVSSGILASKKNRNFIGWFFTGLLFGPFALFVVLLPLLPEKTKDNSKLWTSWKFWTVWVSLFGLIALLAFGFTTDPQNVPSPLVGRLAPDFELTALKGEETIHLSELRGTPVLLNFWASWCQECKVEVHILEEFHKKYGSETEQIRVIGIAIQDTLQNAQAFALRFGKNYYLGLDDDIGNIALDYGIYGVPESFFIDPDGMIFYKQIGGVTQELLVNKFEPFL